VTQGWRGVFAIPCTPFTDSGELDLSSLHRQLEFCLDAGAHGIVAPVNASEFWTLSDDERRTVAEQVIKTVGGKVPVVIGVATGSGGVAASLAKHAESSGAHAVITMPPNGNGGGVTRDTIFEYYRNLSNTVEIPIFVQNYHTPSSLRMNPEFVSLLVRELEHVDYIKEETPSANQLIEAEIRLCGPKLKGVMGGLAGRYLMDEYRRGSCGTMPACEVTDVHVQVWDALEAGEERRARDLFNRLLPLLNYEALTPGVYKAVLKRRGVIASDYMRSHAGNPLDASDQRELSEILADMRDLFRLEPPT
jgi:dihydrodipicolinate synthase/N-acetylneuraminate lyase